MSETKVLLLAISTWLAARFGATVGGELHAGRGVIALLVGAVAISLVLDSPGPFVVSVATLAFGLGSHSAAQYTQVAVAVYEGKVQLVTDPKPTNLGWRAEVKLESGQRLMATVSSPSAPGARSLEAGEVLFVDGVVRPMEPSDWSMSRHLVGRLAISDIGDRQSPPAYLAPSRWFRAAVNAGSESISQQSQDLYLGLVIGDDRFQGSGQRAIFRSAGLSHLLAVSGQNVAFVLAVCAPAFRRVGTGGRLAATLFVLLVFAVATRLEPSVMRATVAAGFSATAMSLGRPSTGIRTLGVAVTALVLVDPFLVYSVGFSLSITASLGILILGPPIERGIPGPASLRAALAVTLSAQLGVAPLLLLWFGPISLVAIPANLLVGWAAGLVMTLGLTLGLVAGLMPEGIAAVVQRPASALLWWIDTVAATAVRLPAPRIDAAGACLLTLLAAVWWFVSERKDRAVARSFVGVIGVLWFVLAIPSPPSDKASLAGGATWLAGGPSILIVGSNADDRLLDSLLSERVQDVEIVVLERGGRRTSQLVVELRKVVDIGIILAPPMHRVVGANRLLEPLLIQLPNGMALRIVVEEDRLDTELIWQDQSS